jgi:hypothetical protein
MGSARKARGGNAEYGKMRLDSCLEPFAQDLAQLLAEAVVSAGFGGSKWCGGLRSNGGARFRHRAGDAAEAGRKALLAEPTLEKCDRRRVAETAILENPSGETRLDFRLDPFVKDLAQLPAKVRDLVQARQLEGLQGCLGAVGEVLER